MGSNVEEGPWVNTLPSDPRLVIRTLSGMFIGNVHDGWGLVAMLDPWIDHVLDAHVAGHGDRLDVTLAPEGVFEVVSNGCGFAVGRGDPQEILSRVVTSFVERPNTRRIGDILRVPLDTVSSLSGWLTLVVGSPEGGVRLALREGLMESCESLAADSSRQAMVVRFKADPTIFTNVSIEFDRVADHLRTMAALHPRLRIRLHDRRQREVRSETFSFPDGLVGYVGWLNTKCGRIHGEVFHCVVEAEGEAGPMRMEVAMQWTDTSDETFWTLTNRVRQWDGGVHGATVLLALHDAFGRTMDWHAPWPGLTFVVSLQHPRPVVTNNWARLVCSDVRPALTPPLTAALTSWLDARPALVEAVLTGRQGAPKRPW